MSSDTLQSTLVELRLNDYTSAAIITAVAYDYILTFSQEIEYVWCKPWTRVSTLFIPVRYFGLFNLFASALGQIISILSAWTFLLFFGATDFVMILRVWALYSRSKFILSSLLALYCAVIISTFISVVVSSIPKNLPAEIIQILDYQFCSLAATVPTWATVAVVCQIAQGGVLCMLAVLQVVKESYHMYTATKQWHLNRYMSLLAKQGILSFLAIFLFNLVNVLAAFGKAPVGGWQLALLILLEYVPIYTLTPRFILSMRELYARDTQSKRAGVDTAFGLSGTAILFASVGQSGAAGSSGEETTMDIGPAQTV